MFGLKRCHLYLNGHHFTILMDHEPLERIFGPQDSYSLIGSHGSSTLGRDTVSIQLQHYRFVSKQNAVADALSRLPLPSTFNGEDAIYRVEERLAHSLHITHKEISYATRVDPVLSRASVCQTRMVTRCGRSTPPPFFTEPLIWVIGRARLR